MSKTYKVNDISEASALIPTDGTIYKVLECKGDTKKLWYAYHSKKTGFTLYEKIRDVMVPVSVAKIENDGTVDTISDRIRKVISVESQEPGDAAFTETQYYKCAQLVALLEQRLPKCPQPSIFSSCGHVIFQWANGSVIVSGDGLVSISGEVAESQIDFGPLSDDAICNALSAAKLK